jgi:anthranilate synthase component I
MHGSRVQYLSQPVDKLALHRSHPKRYPFLLESTSGPSLGVGQQGRYDILFGFPTAHICLHADGHISAEGFVPSGQDFLSNLDRWFAQDNAEPLAELPFQGGWFLYLGYELAGQIEPVLMLPAAADGLPVALAVRCHAGVVHDRLLNRSLLVAEAGYESLLEQMSADISAEGCHSWQLVRTKARIQEDLPDKFIDAVHRIRDYIRAGDVFQTNLSRSWHIELEGNPGPARLYGLLRRVNPAPFSGLMQWGDVALLSSSPERLVHARGGLVETRPIAGTHPRVQDHALDTEQAQALLGHPKERAEHVMLIDLERNDLGRICEPGSVFVNEFMLLETYTHVHHIVSNVQGRLRAGVKPGAIIRAVFPGGTITGCPKIRCMQIIAELEGLGRGAYTGSMGYLDRSGALDLNILIRTLVMKQNLGILRAGAGIVADSEPVRELEETRAKALGLLRLFEAVS